MSEQYLILHKVRGEPAFDIAQKMQIGNEEGWIIPTSGHRAYPLWSATLQEVGVSGNHFRPDLDMKYINYNYPQWAAWPDHYDTKRDQTDMIDKFRAILGLNKPVNNYRRR